MFVYIHVLISAVLFKDHIENHKIKTKEGTDLILFLLLIKTIFKKNLHQGVILKQTDFQMLSNKQIN